MKLIIFMLFIVSCGNRGPLIFEAPMEKQLNHFESFRASILETKCIGCHADFANEDNLLPYIDTNNPDESLLFQVVKDGSMPMNAAPLTTLELEMVRSYIQNLQVVKLISFNELKTQILEPKCLSCHKKMGDEENVKRWIDLAAPMKSKLYTTTLSGRMPKNAAPLTKAEMKIIEGYLKNFQSLASD